MIHLYALLVGIVAISLMIGVMYLLHKINIPIDEIMIWIIVSIAVLLISYIFGALILEGMFGIRLV